MRIANFQAPGLMEAIKFLNDSFKNLKDDDNNPINKRRLAESVLKTINVSFTLEGMNRMQSTMLCELKDSFVQQSQRYVSIGYDSFSLPEHMFTSYMLREAKVLLLQSIVLYDKMSLLKEEFKDFKGRKTGEHYEYGIAIEDARYILALATKTNVAVATSGDKFLNILDLIYSQDFGMTSHNEFFFDLNNLGLGKEFHYGTSIIPKEIKAVANQYYSNIFNLLRKEDDNTLLYSKFENADVIVGAGAATSGSIKTPSEIIKSWGDDASTEATKLTQRVMSYGHTSIIEQARTTGVFKMSLSAYHQFLRHRLPSNFREELIDLTTKSRMPYIPASIKKSIFYQDFLHLTSQFASFRKKLIEYKYDDHIVNLFLLNCDQIIVASSSNAKMDCHMLKDRICKTAQTEIREQAEKRYTYLKELSDVFYKDALPPCIYGQCKEGKMTCGKQKEMIEKYHI